MPDDNVEILLIEDNPDDVELTLRTFQESRIANRIHVARDGAEALEFIFGTGAWTGRSLLNGPRLILLDLKLPKVDGFEVLRQLKTDPRVKILPVVIMTSSQEERDLVESYHLGVNSYIVKPLNFEQFARVVRELGHYWMVLNKIPIE